MCGQKPTWCSGVVVSQLTRMRIDSPRCIKQAAGYASELHWPSHRCAVHTRFPPLSLKPAVRRPNFQRLCSHAQTATARTTMNATASTLLCYLQRTQSPLHHPPSVLIIALLFVLTVLCQKKRRKNHRLHRPQSQFWGLQYTSSLAAKMSQHQLGVANLQSAESAAKRQRYDK